MGRLSTCKMCGAKLTKEEKYTYNNKTYCEKCYNKKLKEKEDYKNLIESICKYFNIDKPDGLILKQIKNYKEDFGYNYTGMLYTLWYCSDILNKHFERKYGIAIIKYEYKNAEEYFLSQQKIVNKLNNIKENKTNIVNINMKKVYNQQKNKFLFDLDEIIGGK